jgi:sulfur carrier protein ThiS
LRQGRFPKRKLELTEGITVGKVLKKLGIEPEDVAILLVNGQDVTERGVLRPDDVLALFPPVAGG